MVSHLIVQNSKVNWGQTVQNKLLGPIIGHLLWTMYVNYVCMLPSKWGPTQNYLLQIYLYYLWNRQILLSFMWWKLLPYKRICLNDKIFDSLRAKKWDQTALVKPVKLGIPKLLSQLLCLNPPLDQFSTIWYILWYHSKWCWVG